MRAMRRAWLPYGEEVPLYIAPCTLHAGSPHGRPMEKADTNSCLMPGSSRQSAHDIAEASRRRAASTMACTVDAMDAMGMMPGGRGASWLPAGEC